MIGDGAVCPRCGGRAVPILYGMPDLDGFEAAERGELSLGGCIVTDDQPEHACTECGTRF